MPKSASNFAAKVEALRKCQRHQLALILDEEERKERERADLMNKSLPRNRTRVAKHFAFKRKQALERIQRIQLSHKQSLEAILKAQPQKKGHD